MSQIVADLKHQLKYMHPSGDLYALIKFAVAYIEELEQRPQHSDPDLVKRCRERLARGSFVWCDWEDDIFKLLR